MGSGLLLRNVANVVNLSTPLGLVIALSARAKLRFIGGLVVAENARLPLLRATAMTVGSVVLVPGQTLEDAVERIPGLIEHESDHAFQYSYCLGLPFIPLYFIATAWSWLRSGDRASANHFEVQAGLDRGGYRRRETRPLAAGLADLRRRIRPGSAPSRVRP